MKTKIVVVDDEIEYLNDITRGLEILGYEVLKAANGAAAIEMINKTKPDIVLCDYKLDDMDGTQIIAKTKAASPDTSYIMVTAYYDESLTDTFKKAGADNIVYKPIQLSELDALIRKSIKARGAAL